MNKIKTLNGLSHYWRGTVSNSMWGQEVRNVCAGGSSGLQERSLGPSSPDREREEIKWRKRSSWKSQARSGSPHLFTCLLQLPHSVAILHPGPFQIGHLGPFYPLVKEPLLWGRALLFSALKPEFVEIRSEPRALTHKSFALKLWLTALRAKWG